MRDKTHEDFVVRWANFVKENPNEWRKIHTEFINSLFRMNENFLKRLSKEPNGKEKIIKLYNIKNVSGYKKLLR